MNERPKIKFSQLYHKLYSGNCRWYAKLIQVLRVNSRDLSPDFIEYDTYYDGGRYTLPKGELIIIFLLTDSDLWTTVRRYTPQKFEYYKGLEGRDVGIEVKL